MDEGQKSGTMNDKNERKLDTYFDWYTLFIRLKHNKNDELDKRIKKEWFLNPEKNKLMMKTISGSDLMDIVIRLDSEDELDREFKKKLFQNQEIFEQMMKILSGSDLVNIIIRLNPEDKLDREFKESLFFNKKRFELMTKKLNGSDLMDIVIRLKLKDELDRKIKELLFLSNEGITAVSNIISSSNSDNRDSEKLENYMEGYQQEQEVKEKIESVPVKESVNHDNKAFSDMQQILNQIYYKDSGVSLNSKKLYMIQVASQILGDVNLAKEIVTSCYDFEKREVDVKRSAR